MKTKIFKDYMEFFEREDKYLNGVSPDFAKDHPDFEKENEMNRGCWNCSNCSDCFDCSDCSDCSGCSSCSGCSDCFRCSDCSDCSNISKKNLSPELTAKKSGFPEIPVIENIHQKVFEAASKPDALDMRDWHTCETTHCRAGWVVTLAGGAGRKLEQKTSSLFAAMQIYKASSPIRVFPPRFFDKNNAALEDMKRCAEEEAKGEA